jgi:hypothetical protein
MYRFRRFWREFWIVINETSSASSKIVTWLTRTLFVLGIGSVTAAIFRPAAIDWFPLWSISVALFVVFLGFSGGRALERSSGPELDMTDLAFDRSTGSYSVKVTNIGPLPATPHIFIVRAECNDPAKVPFSLGSMECPWTGREKRETPALPGNGGWAVSILLTDVVEDGKCHLAVYNTDHEKRQITPFYGIFDKRWPVLIEIEVDCGTQEPGKPPKGNRVRKCFLLTSDRAVDGYSIQRLKTWPRRKDPQASTAY